MTEEVVMNLLDLQYLLGGSFLIVYGILLFWFGILIVAKNWAYDFHSKFFDISNQEFDKMHYFLMGLLKILAFVFLLAPYIMLKIINR